MFDIGFAELILVAVVGLLVLGPDRLPGAIRTVALYVGRIRRGFTQLRSEIEREIGADDIRRQLHNESILGDLKKGKEQLKSLQDDLRQLDGKVKDASQSLEHSIEQSVKSATGHGDGDAPPAKTADVTSSEDKQAKTP